ncbi:MAG: hypothetical protein QNK23_18580 [Crocinitomicaceae bacterium]|nr:hypothetical protein [Crocinitomicaceae bacterium]
MIALALRYILFAALITLFGITQTQLKQEPQIFMIALGITIILTSKKGSIINIILFYLLLTILFFNAIHSSIMMIIDAVSSGHVTSIGPDGIEYPLMDMTGLFMVPVAMILTPIAMVIYHRRIRKKDSRIEHHVTLAFTIISICIFLVHEL